MVQKKPAKFYGENELASKFARYQPRRETLEHNGEVIYKDPTPKTMKDLKRRPKQAWKNILLSTLNDLSHSMPQRLQNVIKTKGGMPDIKLLNTCTR